MGVLIDCETKLEVLQLSLWRVYMLALKQNLKVDVLTDCQTEFVVVILLTFEQRWK